MLVYALFAVGLVLLLLGGEWLVKGAVALAHRLAIPPLIIGLTIVAFGTSAPELIISLRAALGGNGGLSIGNVIGSNIANVLLVLGLPALFAPILCRDKGMGTNVALLVLATAIFSVMMYLPGPLDLVEGLVLLAILAGFLIYQAMQAQAQKGLQSALIDEDEVQPVTTSGWKTAGLVLAGLITLPVAAELTVNSAIQIAEVWAVPDDVIGLTIVAIGTSLPELATALMAARARSTSVLVGSIIGSNFFNIAAIMGITATVVPVPVTQHILEFDVWIMAAATLFLVLLAMFRLTIGRFLGAILFGAYVLYLVATVAL